VQGSAEANQSALCRDSVARGSSGPASSYIAERTFGAGSGLPELAERIIFKRATAEPPTLFTILIVIGDWLRQDVAGLTVTSSSFSLPILRSLTKHQSRWLAMPPPESSPALAIQLRPRNMPAAGDL